MLFQPGPISMHVCCPTCGRPVELRHLPNAELVDQWWVCPETYCHSVHRIEIYGVVIAALASFEPHDPNA